MACLRSTLGAGAGYPEWNTRLWSHHLSTTTQDRSRQLRHYDRTWLRGDLIAGVTVAAYLVPQVLAYAGVAGLPPPTGLWAAVGALVAYAVICSSRRLSVGPESTTALLTDSSDTSPDAQSAASVVPSDLDRATSGDKDLDGEADRGAGLTAAEFCGFLAEETPKVIDVQPAEYAAATFMGALFSFYTDQGLLTDIDGVDTDAFAAKGCPEAAAELLPVFAASSFKELLSK